MGAMEDRISADYYGTLIRATKGKMGHDELLATISEAERAAAETWGCAPRNGAGEKASSKRRRRQR